MYMFIIITFDSVCDRLGSPSDLVKFFFGGGGGECDGRMWSTFGVQCITGYVHVARRARLIYDVVSTGAYKGREGLV